MVEHKHGIFVGIVAAWCVAGVLTLSSCKVATLYKPNKKKEFKVVTRTIRTDSTIIEFVDTTVCPPNLTDTLIVTKRITKTLPPQDIIIHDTIVLREKGINRIIQNATTKNNWWLILVGLIIGFYGKDYLRSKRRDM